jgi:hypothetical protein
MKELYNLLPIGQANAIPISEIAERWNMTPRRARKHIEEMWYNNLPVCNLMNGYFRPENVDELKAYGNIIHSYKCQFERKFRRVGLAIERFNNERMSI